MKFFKKTSVAILLTALLVALCCVWGYQPLRPRLGGAEPAGRGERPQLLSQLD